MNDYNILLDATIEHLQRLKNQGVRHVSVSQDALRALTKVPQATANPLPPRANAPVAAAKPAAPIVSDRKPVLTSPAQFTPPSAPIPAPGLSIEASIKRPPALSTRRDDRRSNAGPPLT